MSEQIRVGFLGLGAMGAPLAANVRKAGYPLVVHDIQRAAAERHLADGATWADTPRALSEQSDVVFLSLPRPVDVETVVMRDDGVLAGIRTGAACFDLSTNSPAMVRKLHDIVAGAGAHFLDAPVSGGPAGAATGKLALWVSGDEAVFNAHIDLLKVMGDRPEYIGEIGSGTVAKLVHNLSGIAIGCVLAETFSLGVKAGVDPLKLWHTIRSGAAGRRRTFDGIERFLSGVYDPPSFALKLAHKDITLATELGRELGVPMRLCDLSLAEMAEALTQGWGDSDMYSVMRLQEQRAQVDVTIESDKLKAELAI